MTINFYLESKEDSKGRRKIFLYIRENKKQIKISTDIRVPLKNWNKVRQRIRPQFTGSVEFNHKMDLLQSRVLDTHTKMTMKSKVIDVDEFKMKLLEEVKPGFIKVDQQEVIKAFDEFIESKSTFQSPRTVQKYKTVKSSIIEFQEMRKTNLLFDKIDIEFFDKYREYLLTEKESRWSEDYGLTDNTISKYMETLKAFLKWSYERELHTNPSFNRISTKRVSKNQIVTLTKDELERLYKLDLSKRKSYERVRDLFCFGCYTGQRWSDITHFDKSQLVEEGKFWQFHSLKTKDLMRIPLVGYASTAKEILEKYKYDLPEISIQKFNEYIKKVGELAEINEEVTIVRYSGNSKIEETRPKHKFMSSHMARRSAVTILLEANVPPTTIMKLTGHKDLKTLMKYENTGEEALITELKRFFQ